MLMAISSTDKRSTFCCTIHHFNFNREAFAKKCKSTTISQSQLSQRFIERNLLKEMMESEIWLNCCFFRVYQHFFISVGKCPREWIIASLQICIWPNQARIVLVTAYWNTRKEGKEYHPSENEEMINYHLGSSFAPDPPMPGDHQGPNPNHQQHFPSLHSKKFVSQKIMNDLRRLVTNCECSKAFLRSWWLKKVVIIQYVTPERYSLLPG